MEESGEISKYNFTIENSSSSSKEEDIVFYNPILNI